MVMYNSISKFGVRKSRIIVAVFFAVFLAVGLSIVKDYGVSWDGPLQRMTGLITYNYITEGDQSLFFHRDRFYGMVFELFLVSLEKMFGLNDIRPVYLMRHTVTFLVFYISVIFFYLLCRDHFKDWKKGLLACLFLVLSPRIFAHAFYNSKDLTFLSVFIISVYFMIRYIKNPSSLNAVIHGFVSAVLIDVRILGVMIPAYTFIFLVLRMILTGQGIKYTMKTCVSFLIYMVSLTFFTVLFWPFLWEDPLKYAVESFKRMSKFPQAVVVLYMGDYIRATDLPWHYIPVWLSVTTPVLYLYGFCAGVLSIVFDFLRKPVIFLREKTSEIVFCLWFFTPLITVIILRSVMYDSWRHLFFIYPAFIIIAVTGISRILRAALGGLGRFSSLAGFIVAATVAAGLADPLIFMIKYHPFQNVYFNRIAGKDMKEIKNKYDLDYWGLSYIKGLRYILDHDKRAAIRVLVANDPGQYNAFLLTPAERKRIVFVEKEEDADYFIGNYRWHREDYAAGDDEEVFSIRIGNAKILVVYKLNKPLYRPLKVLPAM